MKRLLLILVLPVFLWAQVGTPSRAAKIFPKTGFATQFDGSSQYWSKSSPSNLDLNGSERLANIGFETDTSNWTAVNGTYATSTAQKHAGSKSCLLIATGAAASISSETITDATTDKGTGEVWVYCGSAASTKSIKIVLLTSDLTTIDSTVTTVTAVTWTKLVKNKQWPGTQTGLKIRVGFNGGASGDSLYIDDVSLTQAWDGLYLGIVKTPLSGGTHAGLFGTGQSVNGIANLWYLRRTGTETDAISFNSATIAGAWAATASATGLPNGYIFIALTLDRIGNVTIYVNGIANTPGSMTAQGVLVGTSIQIGLGGTDRYFGSTLGEQQFIRFASLPSDIATTIAHINSTWKRQGFPKAYSGGTIVLDIDWKYGGMDKSNSANHLTPTANPPIIQTKFQ